MLRLQKKWGRQEGFTLIELLVVVAILGVLVGIAAPRVIQSLQSARDNRDSSNKQIIQTAVERFAFDNSGRYPALVWNGRAWVATTNNGDIATGATTSNPARIQWSALLNGGYLATLPSAPNDPAKRFVLTPSGKVKIDTPDDWDATSQAASGDPGTADETNGKSAAQLP